MSSRTDIALRTTVACVIQRHNRYLVVEEACGGRETLFNQPAGHVEPGEGPLAAINREVREETAWEIELIGYLGLYVFHAPGGLTFHSHGFVAKPRRFLNTPLDSPITATHWLSQEEMQTLSAQGRLRSPLVLARILDAQTGPIYPLSVIRE
ncbi:NUDIX domain-containing protein [Vreelandella massiliensis]|uniref:NUDIX domain-containing protein n=1 Tax=Vreelandella massiliensis TaxID=1816686 RepID=UPI00096A3FD6|nr:NUDIX domain-containing protein [Halomonas massiliensis]MYL22587.1 NUDIX domain-containing protein [Halomonas alkaliantarctica]